MAKAPASSTRGLQRLGPPQYLRRDRIGDVAEFLVLLDECGHHRAHGDDALPVRAGASSASSTNMLAKPRPSN